MEEFIKWVKFPYNDLSCDEPLSRVDVCPEEECPRTHQVISLGQRRSIR